MAQVQIDSFTISVPVADSEQGNLPPGVTGPLQTHDQNLNGVMAKYRQQGYDLNAVVYVPPGPIAPHFQLFFIKQ